MTVDLKQFRQTFLDECRECLDAMEHGLLCLDQGNAGSETIDTIFRAAHSIKGGAGVFGFAGIARVTHLLETLLDGMRSGKRAGGAGEITVLLQSVDVLRGLLHTDIDAAADNECIVALAEVLEAMLAVQPPERGLTAGEFEIFDEPVPGVAAESANTVVVETQSLRVGTNKVDALINLVGELVITQAMLKQCAGTLDPARHERMLGGLAALERNTRDLQDSVMSVRMLPMDSVFSRFPRAIRDLSAKFGKRVCLKTEGEATELDKGVIEKIVDPLNHLVRNSVDHGLEAPAERRTAGKDEVGTITLAASHRAGYIVIEVSDDGRGLDRAGILASARKRGLDASDALDDAEVWPLIFTPGLSTAQSVTDVSGRGVGMDVVKKNIVSLGGQVDVSSESGKGTRVTIRLPLTLAILDGMSVAVGDETFIVPLNSVVESLQPRAGDVKSIAGQGQVLRVRGEYIPLHSLRELFSVRGAAPGETPGTVVLMEADGRKVAAWVDELIGQQQVVIKNLDTNYKRIQGISGATIMGDGRVALIVDVSGLARMSGIANPA
jgi:two-component system, chemotaxis family, sensor kinase CheA